MGERCDKVMRRLSLVYTVDIKRHCIVTLLLRTGSEAAAADLVQEVFMGLMQDQYRYDPLLGQLQYFLFGVIQSGAQTRCRTAALHSIDHKDEDDENPDDVICENPGKVQRLLQKNWQRI